MIKLKISNLALIFCLLILVPSTHAQEPSVELRVDRSTISQQENLTLSIIIKGGSALTTPELAPLDNFDILGKSQGNSIEVINGQMSLSKTVEYILQARHPGNYPIGPVKVSIDGKTYKAGPIRVVVTKEQRSPAQPLHPFARLPRVPQPSFPPSPFTTPPPVPGDDRDEAFVTVETNKQEAYVGEQIVFTFRFYTSVSVQNAQLKTPEFKDFITEELIKERKYDTSIQGRRYIVNEWRFALFPTKAGNIPTGVASVSGKVAVSLRRSFFDDPFFQKYGGTRFKKKTYRSNNLNLNIKALPPPPRGFTGLVGKYSLTSHLHQDVMNLGETTHLDVEISGQGNINEARLPPLRDFSHFKVYPSKPKFNVSKTLEGLQGKASFKYALVAERPGQASIPPIKLYYFDPESGQYEKLSTKGWNVAVRGKARDERLVTAGIDKSEGILGEIPKRLDLHPLRPAHSLLVATGPVAMSHWFWWMLLVGPPGAWIFYTAWQKYQARAEAQTEDRKRSKAFKTAKDALAKLSLKEKKSLESMGHIISNYFSHRFQVAGGALTTGEIEDLLAQHKIPPEIIRRMIYLLEQLDSWKYGGADLNLAQGKSLKQELTEILRNIEKVL